mmetsp:Transcript_134031/g.334533  ORF Transcript_134031/g.334533 Transcript_134031/m.334533 type:complete len:140 (+) Transcript_134031:57-476(+)
MAQNEPTRRSSSVPANGYPARKASSQYSYAHLPGYSGHQPDTERNSKKMGKTFKANVKPDRFRTEAGMIGVGACQASDMKKAGVPRHLFESNRKVETKHFSHHESYGGHQPIAPRNINHYGKTFGTTLSEWRHLTPRPF